MTDPMTIRDRLREQYLRYYDTPFAVRSTAVMEERRKLLLADGVISRDVWLEPVAPYLVHNQPFSDACISAGAHPDLAPFAEGRVLPDGVRMFEHQFQALKAAEEGQNIIVTAGTGSGKTESFLLPLLSGLLRESQGWGENGKEGSKSWWQGSKPKFSRQRLGESGRTAAVRALVLYPMNALVDDQLKRLRQILDSTGARQWLDTERGGHRIFFGRYTGRTPVPGPASKSWKVEELASDLVAAEKRAASIMEDDRRRYFLPRLDGAEMYSRWDMQKDPPDILISNYSMLNVILLREIEESIFAQTKEWLSESEENRFTLILDELHMYRGTPGTEIRFLLRSLLDRLGIADKPEKVRFLAASASVGEDRDAFDSFIEGFFAQPRDRFTVLMGELDVSTFDPKPLAEATADLVGAGSKIAEGERVGDAFGVAGETGASESDLAALCERVDADGALLHATLTDAQGAGRSVKARAAEEVAHMLFPQISPLEASDALRGMLAAMQHGHGLGKGRTLRAHLFFRSIQGMWACSNADCAGASRHDGDRRLVGKLFASHRLTCDDCGSRVLELLYCQTCGELYLGGYRAEDPEGFDVSYLVPDSPDLHGIPDLVSDDRTWDKYALYWPGEDNEPVKPWTKEDKTFQMSFDPCEFSPGTGRLDGQSFARTGFTFNVTGPADRAFPALPTRCPNCGDDWELTWLGSAEDPGRAKSPVRYMRTGFEKVTQVLGDSLLKEIGTNSEERKLVAFTDSRQDAAKLAVGLERRHFEDTVRQVVAKAAMDGMPGSSDFKDFKRVNDEGDGTPDQIAAYKRFKEEFPSDALKMVSANGPMADATDLAAAMEVEAKFGAEAVPLEQLTDETERRLIALGMNPAGPAPSDQFSKAGKRWIKLVEWKDSPRVRDASDLTQDQIDELHHIRTKLREQVFSLIFAPRRRDFESIGLGWCTDSDSSHPEEAELRAVAIRILGSLRKYKGYKGSNVKSLAQAPKPVRAYLAEAAKRSGVNQDELLIKIKTQLEEAGAIQDWILQPETLRLTPASAAGWRCPACRLIHLHVGAGVCSNCLTELAELDGTALDEENYYAFLANESESVRLNTAELTGQTDWKDAQERQAKFQSVFLSDSESELVDEIDLLSVTTTMEVGVDIGSLRAVLMGNMPPMRFNYQQRVGRAGRRDDPLAMALTVCRGRSHDEYYFNNPARITGDPPPVPYLDLRREPIVMRSALSEVIRRSFKAAGLLSSESNSSVHGDFGTAAEWPANRQSVETWMASSRPEIEGYVEVLLLGCDDSLRDESDTFVDYLAGGVLPDIGRIAGEAPDGDRELSELLAMAGLLPMYGFPTRSKSLFQKTPRRIPATDAIQRDESVALSTWAPGSDVVKDKQIHRVIGIADYARRGRSAEPIPDSLGAVRMVNQCSRCGTLDEGPEVESCPSCGAGAADSYGLRRLSLIEPRNYRTDYRPRDYEGWIDWSASGSRPRITNAAMPQDEIDGALVSSEVAEIFEINDNGGDDWHLVRESNGHGWVDPEAFYFDDQGDKFPRGFDIKLSEEVCDVAFSAIKKTDVLTVGVSPLAIPDWANVDPLSVPRRAAWYSLGFALRGAASRYLEVETNELEVGIRALQKDDDVTAEVFLADSLANGAGYCTHLGKPAHFRKLLDQAQEWMNELSSKERHECDSACYDCLKEYRNSAYHGILDWRLAADLLTLLRGESLDQDLRWKSIGETSLQALGQELNMDVVEIAGSPGVVRDRGNEKAVLVPVHPFEVDGDPQEINRIGSVLAEAQDRGFVTSLTTHFELVRTPSVVFRKFISD